MWPFLGYKMTIFGLRDERSEARWPWNGSETGLLETIIGHYWLLKPSENEVEVTAQRELSDVVFHLLFFAVGLRPLMKTFCRDFLKIFEQMLGVVCAPQLRKRFQKYRRIMKRYRQCVCIIVCDKIPRWLGPAFLAAQSLAGMVEQSIVQQAL